MEDIVELGLEGFDIVTDRYYDYVHDGISKRIYHRKTKGQEIAQQRATSEPAQGDIRQGPQSRQVQHDFTKERPREMTDQEREDPYGEAEDYNSSRRRDAKRRNSGDYAPRDRGLKGYDAAHSRQRGPRYARDPNYQGKYSESAQSYSPYQPAAIGYGGAAAAYDRYQSSPNLNYGPNGAASENPRESNRSDDVYARGGDRDDGYDSSRDSRDDDNYRPRRDRSRGPIIGRQQDPYDRSGDEKASRRKDKSSSGGKRSGGSKSKEKGSVLDRLHDDSHLGSTALGALAGAFIGREVGHGLMETAVGAVIGAFGAREGEKKFQEYREKKEKKDSKGDKRDRR